MHGVVEGELKLPRAPTQASEGLACHSPRGWYRPRGGGQLPGAARWVYPPSAAYCHHPIRLAGRVEQADRQTGEVRTVYDSEREPDGMLLKACGTRRESRCPSCAATYRPTPTSSWPPASNAAKAFPRPWPNIRGCS
jgi:hypothetical protein